jgi:hypothetical protein
MMIKYNGTNVFSMARISDAKKKGVVAQSPEDVHWLRPGWNEFPKEVWEQNKSNPAIKKMLARKVIELFAVKAKIRVRSASTGKVRLVERELGTDDMPIKLKYLDEKLAIKIVLGTLNRDMLNRWLDEERRHRVKKAIRKQVKPLLATEEDDGDDDSYDEEETA